jgi:hypothetical protein
MLAVNIRSDDGDRGAMKKMIEWLSLKGERLWVMIASSVKQVWTLLNSPLVIALVSGLLIAHIARSYSQRDEAAKEFAAQSHKLDAALTELQQRLSYLEHADRTWDKRCNFLEASRAEWDAIAGSGEYVPTSPTYKNISLSVVLTEAERSSGAFDPGYVATRLVGSFSVRPPRTARFVRIQLPWLRTYVSSRMFASSIGDIPIRKGAKMSDDLRQRLGIPTLEQASREMNKSVDEVLRVSSEPGQNLPPCGKS